MNRKKGNTKKKKKKKKNIKKNYKKKMLFKFEKIDNKILYINILINFNL